MSDLVEKVARAITEKSLTIDWREYEDEARAAIRAVLDAIAEPCDAVILAAWRALKSFGDPEMTEDEYQRISYRAMIAALRKELEQ